jgi:hypothetical protein
MASKIRICIDCLSFYVMSIAARHNAEAQRCDEMLEFIVQHQ